MAKPTVQLDALIFGGGVAGLWLLDELHRRSFRALLIENRALGAGQTIASQGILHGGLKYALGGLLSGSAKAVGEMTDLWRRCLDGRAQPDLSGVRILSSCCYLWRTEALASMVGLAAARFGLRTPVAKVALNDRHPALAGCPGDVFRVDEQVIDLDSLLREFAGRHAERILRIGESSDVTLNVTRPGFVETVELRTPSPLPGEGRGEGSSASPFQDNLSCDSRPSGAKDCSQGWSPDVHRDGTPGLIVSSIPPPRRGGGSVGGIESANDVLQRESLDGDRREVLYLKPNVVIFTAGEGNGELRRRVGLLQEAMQLRPLHMVMVRGPLPQLFGHCVDGNKTRVTITSALDTYGRTVWQVGGEIAEKGVHMSATELIQFAHRELPSVLPAVDFTNTGWATYRINRAEGTDPRGARPEGPVWRREGSIITAWPTKLVLAPRLAELIVDSLGEPSCTKTPSPLKGRGVLQTNPRPDVAQPPWEVTDVWHT